MTDQEKRKIEPLLNWIALIGVSFQIFVSDGYMKTYGMFFLELQDKYGTSPQETSIVATIFGIIVIFSSLVNGWLVDRFGCWKMMILSALICATGAIIAAFAPTLPVVFVGYGVFIGWGSRGIFSAAVGTIAKSFIYNRTIANGISFAGGSLGMIVYPYIFEACVEAFTVRGILLVLAGFFLNSVAVGLLVRAVENTPIFVHIHSTCVQVKNMNMEENGTCSDINGIKNVDVLEQKQVSTDPQDHEEHRTTFQKFKAFWAPFMGLKFISIFLYHFAYLYGVYAFLFYIPPYLEEIKMSKFQIATLMSINGVTDLFSRIAVGFIANMPKVNLYLIIVINTTIVGCYDLLVPLMLISGSAYAVIASNLAILGLLTGGLLGLIGQLIVDAVGIERVGTGTGFTGACFGLTMIIAPQVYGKFRQTRHY